MRIFLLGSTMIMGLVAFPVMAQDKDLAAKMELAQTYSKLVPVDAEIKETIEQLALQVPVAQRVQFKAILAQNIKVDRLRSASELALTEIFTVEELKALTEFYKTDAGQAIKDKMPDYQGRLQPVLEQMIQDSLVSLQNQMGAGQ